MSNGSLMRNGKLVQSVDRAVAILQILARDGACRVTDVAEALGIHKSTAFRLLSTLEHRGMVEQDPETARYQLGIAIGQLASAGTADFDLRRIARPICRLLAGSIEETVNLDVLDGRDVLHLDQVNGSSSVMGVNWLGRRSPLHATASGKVFLGNLAPQVRARVLDDELERFTERTITDRGRLEAEVRTARTRGFATAHEELEIGVVAAAAAIVGMGGELIGAISVSGPPYRLDTRLDEVGRAVARAAVEVSTRLGALEPRPA
jgi:IclR family transcriptional regulator, acetate operon repressor